MESLALQQEWLKLLTLAARAHPAHAALTRFRQSEQARAAQAMAEAAAEVERTDEEQISIALFNNLLPLRFVNILRSARLNRSRATARTFFRATSEMKFVGVLKQFKDYNDKCKVATRLVRGYLVVNKARIQALEVRRREGETKTVARDRRLAG
jgi:hypothetical protein